MTFRFIHSADWQLGKPFAKFDPDLAGELSAARFSAIARLAGLARETGGRHVLVAGDVFDDVDLPVITLRRGLERMAEQADISWLLLPGNHDPHRRGGIWDRLARLGLPANVDAITSQEPKVLSPGYVLLPAPLTSKNPGTDPSAWMNSAATPEGAVRIGLAHGSVQGFGSDGESTISIAKDRAKTAGLAYLALGDWHGTTKVDNRTWYAGTPEPDRYPSNDPGNALAVTVTQNASVQITKKPTAEFHWSLAAHTIASIKDIEALEASWRSVALPMPKRLIRLSLAGSLSMQERAELDAIAERWSAVLRHLELVTDALVVRPTTEDLASLGSDGAIVEAAKQLAARAADANDADAPIAAIALQRLFGFATEARRETPSDTPSEKSRGCGT